MGRLCTHKRKSRLPETEYETRDIPRRKDFRSPMYCDGLVDIEEDELRNSWNQLAALLPGDPHHVTDISDPNNVGNHPIDCRYTWSLRIGIHSDLDSDFWNQMKEEFPAVTNISIWPWGAKNARKPKRSGQLSTTVEILMVDGERGRLKYSDRQPDIAT
ncbi:hypothetical protein FQN55_000862 [Onygenales sp. PD_40]|nr:hypothetical protein FQN55_000862 [Onygenales sp. PD_40]